jgi:hypothetical protein
MLKKILKEVLAVAVTSAIVFQTAAVFADSLPSQVETNSTDITGANQTFATSSYVANKGISDDLTEISFTNPGSDYVIAFDMTMNTQLRAGSTDKGVRDSFGIGLSSGKEGGYFQVSGSTATSNTIIWKTSSTASLGSLDVGTTYHMYFKSHNTSTLEVIAVNAETGKQVFDVTGLGLRNSTVAAASKIQISQNAREEGQEDSVTIENARIYVPGPDSIVAKINNKTASSTKATEITYDPSEDYYSVELIPQADSADLSDYTVVGELVDSDSDKITYSSGKLVIDSSIEKGTYNAVLKTYIDGDAKASENIIEYPISVTVEDLDPAAVVENFGDKLTISTKSGDVISADEDGVYSVASDLTLKSGSAVLPVSWTCYQKNDDGEWVESNLITSEGVINPTDFSGEVKLVASFSYGTGEAAKSGTKEFPINLVNALSEYIQPFEEETTKVVSVDNEETLFDLTAEEPLTYDVVLPTSKKLDDGVVNVVWTTSDDEHLSIKTEGSKTTAEICTFDYDNHEVTLTGEYSYVKNGTTLYTDKVEYKVNVKYDENCLGKYKVRFDSNYDDNFSSVPSSTSSDITLPTTGKFGSTISWSSDSPGIISSSGKYTRPVTSKNVVLTATVTAPDTTETGKYTKTVSVTGTGITTAGGGGGSVSSGSTSSKVTGTTVAGSATTPSTSTTASTSTAPIVTSAPAATEGFVDLGSVSWAEEAINGLAAKGVVSGKSDTEFAPNDNVTRAEFAKILVGAFGLSGLQTTADFTDVSEDDWFYNYVAVAYGMGVITGYDDGTFGPNDLITRQDMAVMVDRAASAIGVTLENVNDAVSFEDANQIADYAQSAVTKLQKAGIINGTSDTTFSPLDNATRAQAAKILYSFCK